MYLLSVRPTCCYLCSALSGDAEKLRDEFPVSSVDDVLNIIKSDYDKAYFVTGNFFHFYFPLIKHSLLPDSQFF